MCENCDDEVNNSSCDNFSFNSIESKHLILQMHADNVFVQTVSSLSAQNNNFRDSNMQEPLKSMHNVSDNICLEFNCIVFYSRWCFCNGCLFKFKNHACHTLNLGLTGKGMPIGHLKIQGLSNKIDQVKLIFQVFRKQIERLSFRQCVFN